MFHCRITLIFKYIIITITIAAGSNAMAQVFDFEGDNPQIEKVNPSLRLYNLHHASFKPKVGGIDFDELGNIYFCTWDKEGAVYKLSNHEANNIDEIKIQKIAQGLCEPLGLKYWKSKIYIFQRPEFTQLIDHDGDGIMDEYRTVCDSFGYMGNYHEFTFGVLHQNGKFYGSLSTPRRERKIASLDRGTFFEMDTLGNYKTLATGLRTPNGMGFLNDSTILINDNQGEWVPTSKMVVYERNAFYGYRDVDFRYYSGKDVKLPAVWFPHFEVGNSPSEIQLIKKGVFKGQTIHGDVTHGGLKRVFLENIKGAYQGCVFNFSQGFAGGLNRLSWLNDSTLIVGAIGSIGNWSQENKLKYGLQKVVFTDKSYFDILKIEAKTNGFKITFTKEISKKSIQNISKTLKISQWRYEVTENYGGPKLDEKSIVPDTIIIDSPNNAISIVSNQFSLQHVVYFKFDKQIYATDGDSLWVSQAWYTLNNKPDNENIKYKIIAKSNIQKAKPTLPKTISTRKYKPEISLQTALKEGPKLIQNSGCGQCHDYEAKIIGPSFFDIAQKYKNDSNAEKWLNNKIYKGGNGVWGQEMMAAQSHISKEQIALIVKYLLSLK